MSNTTAPELKPQKSIVVEDEERMGLTTNIILHEKDYELDYVNNLQSADEYLQKEKPSVLF
jgi:DNA-binding response OmpR family regulator